MYGGDSEIEKFIFHFFDMSEYFLNRLLKYSDNEIDFIQFQSIMNHLPPSIFFVALKSAEDRSTAAHSISDLSSLFYRLGSKI